MVAIRIWALESDYDRDTVGKLANKLIKYLNIENVSILTAGKRAYTVVTKVSKRKKIDGLKIAVESYLLNNEKVIFVIDSDSDASLAKRREEPNSFISQIEKITKSEKFSDKVYLAMAIQELEAWLLTDCLGICCYFIRNHYKDDCRQKIMNTKIKKINKKNKKKNKRFQSIIKKYQKGNTEGIVEPSKDAKEHLIKFSKEILKIMNPKMKPKDIDNKKYRERLSPEIVDYIEISDDVLRRNESLRKFSDLLSN